MKSVRIAQWFVGAGLVITAFSQAWPVFFLTLLAMLALALMEKL